MKSNKMALEDIDAKGSLHCRLWGNMYCWQGHSHDRDLLCLSCSRMATPSLDEAQDGKKLLWALVWMLTVCADNVHHSLLPMDIYGLRLLPYRDCFLLRLAKPTSLIYLCITLAHYLSVCNNSTFFLVQLFAINLTYLIQLYTLSIPYHHHPQQQPPQQQKQTNRKPHWVSGLPCLFHQRAWSTWSLL